MDMAIIWDLFTNVIDASAVLQTDSSFRDSITQMKNALFPMQVGSKGQLQEWYRDFQDTEPLHRHLSHLYGLYPGRQITAGETKFFNAAKHSLELRTDVGTGWSKGWKINWWARLLVGDHAYLLIRQLLHYTNINKVEMQNSGGTGETFRGMKPQLVAFIQDGKIVQQQNTHIQVRAKFQPEKDGLTFHLAAAFYDTVPEISRRLSDWAKQPPGTKLGHAPNADAIYIEKICGPLKKLSDTTFIFQLEKGIDLNASQYTLTFAAKHPGDKSYRSAVQQGEIVIPAVLKEGVDQTLSFPPIPDQKRGVGKLILTARSSAGVPVNYFILEGPAELEGSTLKFTSIPPRSKFPLKVTVVAWQYGRSSEPKIKTADPVFRSFYITK